MLNSGRKVALIQAIDDINFIYDAAKKFGSSTIVTNIETVKINDKYYILNLMGEILLR